MSLISQNSQNVSAKKFEEKEYDKECDVMREQEWRFTVNTVYIATFSDNCQAHCNEILILILRYLWRNTRTSLVIQVFYSMVYRGLNFFSFIFSSLFIKKYSKGQFYFTTVPQCNFQ